ncbi:MAG: Gmad2 immunoglobulin-like domain-containing protein [Bacillota bacterium]|nr:Gmad2 immunoglobulin-like domain-containing protein [Bacillota bacterium]
MHRRGRFVLVVIATALFLAAAPLLAACNGSGARGSGPGGGGSGQAGGEPSTIRHVSEAEMPAYELAEWVRGNRQRLFWGFFTFGGTRYLLVSRGESPNPGYGVRVTRLRSKADGTLVVTATWSEPEPGRLYAQVISYPYDLIATPASTPAYELQFEGAGAPASPGRVEPDVQVTAPAPGTRLASPFRLRGKARAFEGRLQVELEDGHDVLLRKVLTGPGAPEWMEIDEQLAFARPTNPSGMLTVYTLSPRDGSKQNVVMIPVRFSP